MEIEFVNGRVYQYYDVSDTMHDELMQASSKEPLTLLVNPHGTRAGGQV